MKKLLLALVIILIAYSAQAKDIAYQELGRIGSLDTALKTISYNVPYQNCDTSVVMVEVSDTLTIESAILEVSSINGYKVSSDTLLSSTTISGGVKAIAVSALPYKSIYTKHKLIIKLKGKTYKKASAIFTMIYLKEN